MKIGVPYLALGIGLLTGTLFAFGQTPHPMLVAQAPSFRAPIRSSDNTAASPRRRAAIGRSGGPADGRAPHRCHPAVQDSAKRAKC